MQRLGFHEQWISLIMECVTTVKYQVKVNDDLTDSFTPERPSTGGSPIPLHIFTLCQSLLSFAEKRGSRRIDSWSDNLQQCTKHFTLVVRQ